VSAAVDASVTGVIDATGAVSLSAGTVLTGNVFTRAGLTIEAAGSLLGNVHASGAVTLGAESNLIGSVSAGGAVTRGAGATLDDSDAAPLGDIPPRKDLDALAETDAAYATTWQMTGGNDLDSNIANDILLPGLYTHSSAWPLLAGKNITLTGDASAVWIFRIDGAAAISGSFLLSAEASGANVYFVVSGAFSLGAGSEFHGTVITPAAIAIAAGARFTGDALKVA
jgi:cytoskeletal protein CcmA (bactofilin family)